MRSPPTLVKVERIQNSLLGSTPRATPRGTGIHTPRSFPELADTSPRRVSSLRRVRTWGAWDRELAEEGISTRPPNSDAQHDESMSTEERSFMSNIFVRR